MPPTTAHDGEFPALIDDNQRIWEANAEWWDDRIGDGNVFQTHLIEPATERLLAIAPGDIVLDLACGAGRMARRIAASGARVGAVDQSAAFIARARERTPAGSTIEFHVVNVDDTPSLLALSPTRFDKAVCTMAIMDMARLRPLFSALARLLVPGGAFVFSVTHPCFHSATMQRFVENGEDEDGRYVARSGVKVSAYLTPSARKTEGIIGQPVPQWSFHRPLSALLQVGFDAGFVVDGLEEPRHPDTGSSGGPRWSSMLEIPPVMVVRMRLPGHGRAGDR